MSKKLIIILSSIISLILLLLTVLMVSYNKTLKLSHQVEEKYTTISIAIENRLEKFEDLLGALNNAEAHVERQLSKITEARKSLNDKENLNDITEDMELLIRETTILIEDNPSTFIATNLYSSIMSEISATVNMISTTKIQYNKAVTDYNFYISKFPTNIFAKMFKFENKELYNPNLI